MAQRPSYSISPLFWPRASLDALLWTSVSSETLSLTRKKHHTGTEYYGIGLTRDMYSKESKENSVTPWFYTQARA